MPSKIALAIGLLAAAIGIASAAHIEAKSHKDGRSAVPNSENKLVHASGLPTADETLFKRGYNWNACKKYVYNYNGGHNVYTINDNKLFDFSDATIDISVLSSVGKKQETWKKAPRHCAAYIKSHNGGHNVVVDNENKLFDLSSLNLDFDFLRRDDKFHNGGHNIDTTNENRLFNFIDIDALLKVLSKRSDSFSSYNGGHNTESTSENKLFDLSGLNLDFDLLKRDDKSHNGGHNIDTTNKNKLFNFLDVGADVDILSKKGSSPSASNGGHNIDTTNENRLFNFIDIDALLKVLSKRSDSFSSYNGGHNTESTSENKLFDLSGLNLDFDLLKRDDKSHNGGHNIDTTNKNKLFNFLDVGADVDILSKKGSSPSASNGGHNIDTTNENKLFNFIDIDALLKILSKRSDIDLDAYVNLLSQESHRTDGYYGSKIQAREIHESIYRRTNGDEDCSCVKKPKKPTPPKRTTLEPSSTSKPIKFGDCDAVQPPKTWTKSRYRHHHHTSTASASKPSGQETKPQTTKLACGPKEVYINEGHNVVSTTDNKLFDLSDITIHIGILTNLYGKKETKTVKGDTVCTSSLGCCVSESAYYHNGGHNVESTSENKGVDLSGLNFDLDIL